MKPEPWARFVADLDARHGVRVAEYGLFHVAAYHWTAEEIDAAEELLAAFVAISEHDPAGLDLPLHQWATQRRQDVREGRWWHARRRGLSATLRRRRDAEHAAVRFARQMREGVAA